MTIYLIGVGFAMIFLIADCINSPDWVIWDIPSIFIAILLTFTSWFVPIVYFLNGDVKRIFFGENK